MLLQNFHTERTSWLGDMEVGPNERRVAYTPAVTSMLTKKGFTVNVQEGWTSSPTSGMKTLLLPRLARGAGGGRVGGHRHTLRTQSPAWVWGPYQECM